MVGTAARITLAAAVAGFMYFLSNPCHVARLLVLADLRFPQGCFEPDAILTPEKLNNTLPRRYVPPQENAK